MMVYILQATIGVSYVALMFWFLIRTIEDEDWRYGIGAAVMLILLLAFVMKLAAEDNAKGPCVKYETQWSYNAATKTNMPYKVCVERGEWVK
jgi:hypothetical protein